MRKEIEKINLVRNEGKGYKAWGEFKDMAEEHDRIIFVQNIILEKLDEIIDRFNSLMKGDEKI